MKPWERYAAAPAAGDVASKPWERYAAAPEEVEKPAYQMTDEDREIFGSITSSPTLGDGALNSLAIGMDKGFTNVIDGARDLYNRATGDDDALARINKEADYGDAAFNRDFDGDWWAKGGELGGEVIATAPLGGVTAKLGAGAMAAGRTARLAAAEGFAAEALTQRGGLQDRAVAGAGGAVGGAAGDLALKGVGRVARAHLSNVDANGIKARHLADDTDAAARVRQAAEDGGYQLDAVDAERRGYLEREALRGNDQYDTFKQGQHTDIIDKARSFLPEDAQGAVGQGAKMREAAADDLFAALKSKKDYSEAEVDAFYEEWRRSMGGEKVPLPGLEEKLTKFLDPVDGEILNADKATGEGIREVLTKYGMLGNPESSIRDAAGNPIAKGGFSVGQIEKVRQELNGYYTPGLSKTGKRALEQAKEIVDEHVALHAFKGLKDESVQTLYKGQKATEGYRIHQGTWGNKTFLGKLTRAGIDGTGFAESPTKALRSLLSQDKVADLQKLKDVMEFGDEAQRAAWKNITELPLIEALEAGLKGSPNELGIAAFERALPKSPKARQLLWGDKSDDIDKAIRAWKLNGTKPPQKGNINTSNTAMVHDALSVGARVGAASGLMGRVGQLLLAVPSAMKMVRTGIRNGAREIDVQRLVDGQLPQAAEAKLMKEMKEEMIAAYGDASIAKYDNALNLIIRNTIREMYTGDSAE